MSRYFALDQVTYDKEAATKAFVQTYLLPSGVDVQRAGGASASRYFHMKNGRIVQVLFYQASGVFSGMISVKTANGHIKNREMMGTAINHQKEMFSTDLSLADLYKAMVSVARRKPAKYAKVATDCPSVAFESINWRTVFAPTSPPPCVVGGQGKKRYATPFPAPEGS